MTDIEISSAAPDSLISGFSTLPTQVSANIALEAFLIRPSDFLGLSCTALQRPSPSPATSAPADSGSRADKDTRRERRAPDESLLIFKCHTVNSSGSPASQLSKVGLRLINGVKPSQICCSALFPASVGEKSTKSSPRSGNRVLYVSLPAGMFLWKAALCSNAAVREEGQKEK